jgi:hypothetical protein
MFGVRALVSLMTENRHLRKGLERRLAPVLAALALATGVAAVEILAAPGVANAQQPVSLSLMLKDQKFDPAELHAPPDTPIEIHLKNLNPIVSEFESDDLHFEKIVPAGSEISVRVRPQHPGRYRFFDDFHRDTQGYLVVP